MSTAKHLNEEQLLRTISYKLEEYEITFGKDDHLSEDDIHARFERLIKVAVEQAGEKAVIIIDEYDSPLLDVMNDKERLAPMRQIMRNLSRAWIHTFGSCSSRESPSSRNSAYSVN